MNVKELKEVLQTLPDDCRIDMMVDVSNIPEHPLTKGWFKICSLVSVEYDYLSNSLGLYDKNTAELNAGAEDLPSIEEDEKNETT